MMPAAAIETREAMHLCPACLSDATLVREDSTALCVACGAVGHLREFNISTAPLELLTAREREIAALVARGERNKQIGLYLRISEATVKNHLANIFAKLGIQERTSLALWYVGAAA
jgi:DNA-binding NarL/FixJ family response regulator